MSRGGKKHRKKKDAAHQASADVLTSALSKALNIPVREKAASPKNMLLDKTKPHVPTAFLWQMLHRERMVTAPHGDLVDVAGRLIHIVYPGIEYWPSQTDTILNDLVRPELEKEFVDRLVGFKSEAEALLVCGNRVNVGMLRRCEGAEWETWHAEKLAVTEAKKTAQAHAALARQWELAV